MVRLYEYAATTQVKFELSILKSLPIDGNAILTLPTLIAYHQMNHDNDIHSIQGLSQE